MMKQIDQKDVPRLLRYLRNDIENCLYLYIDVSCYGTDHVDVWMREDGDGIDLVAMKYHDSFQIYSHKPDPALTELVELLNRHAPAMINAKHELALLLEPYFADDYTLVTGNILRLDRFIDISTHKDIAIEEATLADVDEIAALICEDEYYRHVYTLAEMKAQLTDRIRTGMGVSYIIRDGKKIIAHDSITAQVDDICIAGIMIVHKDYRKTNYAILLEKFMIEEARRRNKKLFGFSTNKRREKQFVMMGNRIVARYGKLVKQTISCAEKEGERK